MKYHFDNKIAQYIKESEQRLIECINTLESNLQVKFDNVVLSSKLEALELKVEKIDSKIEQILKLLSSQQLKSFEKKKKLPQLSSSIAEQSNLVWDWDLPVDAC